MKSMIIGLILALAVFAQEVDAPATHEDVKDLQKEIARMRREVEKTAKGNATERARFEKQNADIKDAEQKLVHKLESIEREARNTALDQLRTQRNTWSVIGVIIIFLVLTFLVFSPGKHATSHTQSFVVAMPGEKPLGEIPQEKQEILKDPEIPELKAYSERNNNIKRIPFVLTLQDGRQFNCLAELRGEDSPLVYIGEDKTPCRWDKRRQAAVKKTSGIHVAS